MWKTNTFVEFPTWASISKALKGERRLIKHMIHNIFIVLVNCFLIFGCVGYNSTKVGNVTYNHLSLASNAIPSPQKQSTNGGIMVGYNQNNSMYLTSSSLDGSKEKRKPVSENNLNIRNQKIDYSAYLTQSLDNFVFQIEWATGTISSAMYSKFHFNVYHRSETNKGRVLLMGLGLNVMDYLLDYHTSTNWYYADEGFLDPWKEKNEIYRDLQFYPTLHLKYYIKDRLKNHLVLGTAVSGIGDVKQLGLSYANINGHLTYFTRLSSYIQTVFSIQAGSVIKEGDIVPAWRLNLGVNFCFTPVVSVE